ncbi:hypothetical protein PR202_ga22265 [Eleusine coracana subsp. coracana]|uniref:Cupin type-1 domain-containing protein n=1 Tax=Eleusine coracana subsp. coracana TaxID=191504 RepID=A0AAV5D2X1_ELECO|nr:hypothetical protein PR202_ga22265 [Eleusine coracana subsp. coracana]
MPAMARRGWARGAAAFAVAALAVTAGRRYGWDRESALAAFRQARDALGPWAAPAYVAAHALTLALCPPYAIFFEGAAALIFGFLPGVACVFSAKVLGASLSFWIGRAIFRYFTSAMEWLQKNKYFHVVVKGVERDGWKFVLYPAFSFLGELSNILLPLLFPKSLRGSPSNGNGNGDAKRVPEPSNNTNSDTGSATLSPLLLSFFPDFVRKPLLGLFIIVSKSYRKDLCPMAPESERKLFMNGFPCKHPSTVVASDFKTLLLNHAGDLNNMVRSSVNMVTATEFPGLNTLGLSVARTDVAPGGAVLPHYHLRASEMMFVHGSNVVVGFFDTKGRQFQKTLGEGDVFIFPRGLVHYIMNYGFGLATTFSVLNSQNPGVVGITHGMFAPDSDVVEGLMSRMLKFGEVGVSENSTSDVPWTA